MKGKLVVLDGQDGSGKSTAMQGLIDWARDQKKSIFDLRKYEKDNNRIPEFSEISDFDVIVSCEPTLAWVGRVIKEEMIRSGNEAYSGLTIAQAFALDREMLFKRVIIPALDAGKIVFQERGVITSFVYQPLQIHISLSELMNLPGNKIALKYAPSLIIICTTEPEFLSARFEQKPDHTRQIFEEISFQRNIFQRYSSEWLQSLFTKFGSTIKYISTNPPKTEEETKNSARQIWEEFIH